MNELQSKSDSLKIQLTDLNQALRIVYDELRDAPASKKDSILEAKERLEQKIKFVGHEFIETNKKIKS